MNYEVCSWGIYLKAQIIFDLHITSSYSLAADSEFSCEACLFTKKKKKKNPKLSTIKNKGRKKNREKKRNKETNKQTNKQKNKQTTNKQKNNIKGK